MKFKKCTVALCVSTAILSGALQARAQTEISTFSGQQQQERSFYTLYLESATPVDAQSDSLRQRKDIIKFQDDIFNQVKNLDPSAQLVSRSALIANVITIQASSSNLEKIKSLQGVKYTFNGTNNTLIKPTDSVHSTQETVSAAADETVTLLTPYTGNASAGAGVSVAILSTGIDYTLPIFGGSGVYGEDNDPETPPPAGSYLEALENGAIAYDGFPTAVVAGGWDFSSENYGNDANPIDQNLSYESWNGWVYPTGMGTELASIVHQLAPGAALHAYKISNVSGASWDPSYITASAPTLDKIVSALEHALDPNQDGDLSDHLDIALLDASGAGAFFDIDGNAGPSLLHLLIERVSALGLTVVTHSGDLAEYSLFGDAEAKHRSWISQEGGATSVITVGSVELGDDGETLTVPTWAPMGPVRGSQTLKPELVTYTNNQPVARISNADENEPKFATRSDAVGGAARIAAAAAVIKSQHPEFGPLEIKALLANTASLGTIFESDGVTKAEIYSVGHGVENIDAATSSPVVAWESDSKQPYVQFGMHEVSGSEVIHKKLTLRNLSDTAQTYTLSYNMVGDKAAHEALMVNLPETVSIPARSSIQIPVTMVVDGMKLPAWPLISTADHTDANLKATELNGYIHLASEGHPELKLGWMLQARNNTRITKRPNASEYPKYLGWNPDTFMTEWEHLTWAEKSYAADDYGNAGYQAYVASFVNDSATPTTFQAYPLLVLNRHEPVGKEDVKGHKIHAVGGAILDEAACSVTGKKLNIAVNFFQPADMAIANYADKIGARLFYYDLFFEAVVLENGWDKSFGGASLWDEAQIVNQPFVALNDKGQPTTYVIDYTVPYDWNNPGKRYKESSLPTHFANKGKNVVSQVCLEDLYHHELDSVEDFDQNFGFHIETDRDAASEQYAPITQFNPIKGGYYSASTQCYFDEWSGSDVCTDAVNDRSVKAGFAKMGQDVPVNELDFAQTYTAQPGEEVYIASAAAPSQYGINQIESAKGFMVVSLNDDFMEVGYNALLDDDGNVVAEVKAGQEFSVSENVEYGTVVGKIELDTQGFFTYGANKYDTFLLHIVNTLEGTPFAINQETQELFVVNPDAIDYENNQMFEVKITTQLSNNIGDGQTVTVHVLNANDLAPELNQEVADAITVPTLTFKKGASGSFTIDVTGLFSDAEGDSLSYQVEGTGFKSLSINGSLITGELDAEGQYTIVVTASDGVNEVSHTLAVEATFEPKKDSGGSMGMLSLLLAGMISIRRKFK